METKKIELYDEDSGVFDEMYFFLKAKYNIENGDTKYKSIAILSCDPKEGRTTISINLSIKFAMGGAKVLLVDTDIKKLPTNKKLKSDMTQGLSAILSGKNKFEDIVMETNVDNLNYISSGFKYIKHSDILLSMAFENFLNRASLLYDIVIIDTPALTTTIDGIIVASIADGAALIVKSNEVEMEKLKRMKERLEEAKVNVLGAILNRVTKQNYRKYYK